MAGQGVDAVWFWRYLESPFRAVYGRFPGTQYTKDYVQASGDCAHALDDLFPGIENDVDIEYRWPGGTAAGRILAGNEYPDRVHVRWFANHPPDPWKMQATAGPLQTFVGDPTKTTAAAANAELARFRATDTDPWIVAVKLKDEPHVLHARAYLGNPPAGLEHTSTAELPLVVQQAMTHTRGCGVVRGAGALRAADVVARVLSALQRGPNVLLVGPPGTGKTVALEDLRDLYEGTLGLLFDPDKHHDAWSFGGPATETKVASLVFHPSYSYEEFVLGLVPKGGPNLELAARPGPLISLAHWAAEPGNGALLILDEFNRGNAAAIFGDTLALLDKDKRDDPTHGRLGASIARGYPDMEVEVAKEYGTASEGVAVPASLRLPASLQIVAALNSSDRSVAPLDAALRRRFSIVRVPPDYPALAKQFGVALPADAWLPPADPTTWTTQHVRHLAIRILQTLNRRIEAVLGEDFLLGHAYLWGVGGSDAPASVESLSAAFDEHVAGNLRLTFADQDELLGAVLGVGTEATGGATGPKVATWAEPEVSIAAVASPRLRLIDLRSLHWQDAAIRLAALLQ